MLDRLGFQRFRRLRGYYTDQRVDTRGLFCVVPQFVWQRAGLLLSFLFRFRFSKRFRLFDDFYFYFRQKGVELKLGLTPLCFSGGTSAIATASGTGNSGALNATIVPGYRPST